ncbi:uroporphyrinogen decarboxylase family protein [Peptoniphilus catoniae]|uniref:uroporphyrinogen decarboxylase family protein n=1 Tax=Peptoniphilus catoniae TaxID=1660341 RepID=UPI0010FDDC59|nr:uroporphyrinogen decarboxylase family protein [Peptoniphilus catoniae]
MKKMTKKERILAAIEKKEVDRIPFSIWYHLPEIDQDAVHLAEVQIELAHLYDMDFIKLMPYGNYGAHDFGLSCNFYCTPTQPVFERKFAIDSVEEWKDVKALPGCFGEHGKQVQLAREVKKQLKGEEIPFVQTVFSPLTTAKKLAGKRIFEDMRSHPDYIHHALEEITKTTIEFVKLNIEAGVAGFFFASQCSTTDYMTEEEYKKFGVKYDLEVLKACNEGTYFNILHIHGDHTMFELLDDYPVQCINWHDRWTKPSMKEARKLSDKCFLGGINEKWLVEAKPGEIKDHIREVVMEAGPKGMMITPGCVAKLDTPEVNYYAARTAVEGLYEEAMNK